MEITNEDFGAVAKNAGIKKADAIMCLEEVRDAISNWTSFAQEAELSKGKEKSIGQQMRQ